ncbi:MAG: hypothetical protein H0V29_11780, partial [Thermoleophilaceae bacterium]|nr:hypothetical protein [Thermoleophilaceae bacterium]
GTGMRLNPIYVEDAAAATIAALDRDGAAVVNVAGPEVVTMRSLAEALGDAIGAAPRFEDAPPAADIIASTARQAELLGVPSTGVEEGVGLTFGAGR